MEKDNKEKDPFDKIFMGEHEEYWFKKGQKDMLRKLKLNKKIEDSKTSKENKYRELEGTIFELKENIRAVEKAVIYWKRRAESFEIKAIKIVRFIEGTKSPKKEKKRTRDILYSNTA